MPLNFVRKIVNKIALFVTAHTSKFVHNFPTPLESTPSPFRAHAGPFKFAHHIRG